MAGRMHRLIEQIEADLQSEIDVVALVSAESTTKTIFSGRSLHGHI